MLAQNFKSAADLEISEPQLDALRKTLVLLETGRIVHVPNGDDFFENCVVGEPKFDGLFNMGVVATVQHCGTVCCIQGTAQLVGKVDFDKTWPRNHALEDLFYTKKMNTHDITPAQAATALRSYLTTGNARWDLAVGEASGLHPDR